MSSGISKFKIEYILQFPKTLISRWILYNYSKLYDLESILASEGGTGENRSDVTPLNFWIVRIYLAKNL